MSVDFDPVRLRPKRRRIDPSSSGSWSSLVGLARPSSSRGSRPAGGHAATPGPAVAGAAPRPRRRRRARPRPSSRCRRARRCGPPADLGGHRDRPSPAHDEWGVARSSSSADRVGRAGAGRLPRAVVRAGPMEPPTSRSSTSRRTESIVALGVTFPSTTRRWTRGSGGSTRTGSSNGSTPDRSSASHPTLRCCSSSPRRRPSRIVAWTGGHYRIDVLVDDGVAPDRVGIPGGSAPIPDPMPGRPRRPTSSPRRTVDPSVTRQGLFATVDGVSVALAATVGPPLDEAAEWHAGDRGRAAIGRPSASRTCRVRPASA